MGVTRFGKLPRLRAVIGLKPELTSMNFDVETSSLCRRNRQ
jgi:hypothetical protein